MERTLTKKGQATRQRIIEGAAHQIRLSGAEFTLDDVCAATHTSKSQLFHYFPEGRKQLLLEVVRYETDQELAAHVPYLTNLSTWPGWPAWRDALVERYQNHLHNDPMCAAIAALPGDGLAVQAILHGASGQLHQLITAAIEGTQSTGDIGPQINPAHAATALITAIQGGAAEMMCTDSTDHLATTIDFILDALRLSGTIGAPAATRQKSARSTV